MGPDHSTGRGERWEQFGIPCHLINAPQLPHRLHCDSSLTADLAIYSYIVTVSGQYLSVAITLSNKMDFSYCDNIVGFCKSSHKYVTGPGKINRVVL